MNRLVDKIDLLIIVGSVLTLTVAAVFFVDMYTHAFGQMNFDSLKQFGLNMDNVTIDENGNVVGFVQNFTNAKSSAPEYDAGMIMLFDLK